MTDDPDEVSSKQEQDLRRLKPPSKKKYDEEMESITNQIRAIETELKQISVKGNESLQLDARSIRAEISATIERRKKIDNELRTLNQNISKQMDKLTKIQSALHYRSEDRINDAIRRLEFQMKTRNFKLSEEKKIVAEIDSLNRSKKSLVQFTTLKKEIDGMRDSQRRMRGERDHYYKAVTQLKNKEDDLRKKSQLGHVRAAEFKKELDLLYEKKRALTSQYRKIEKEYYEIRGEAKKKLREETFKRREEEKKALQELRQKELDEYEASREPYEDEKLLCNTLITYLQRYLVSNDHDQNQEHAAQHQVLNETAKELEEKEGMFVLRKKKSDEDLFGGVQRSKGKRSKRDKRKSSLMLSKPITHSPEIFEKFASLNLSAPSIQMEVPISIDQLISRKEYYHKLSGPIKSSMDVPTDNESHTGSSAASMSESAICESIPSTPEVHHDNHPPAFPTQNGDQDQMFPLPQPRKYSTDSGACSDPDDITECGSSAATSSTQASPTYESTEHLNQHSPTTSVNELLNSHDFSDEQEQNNVDDKTDTELNSGVMDVDLCGQMNDMVNEELKEVNNPIEKSSIQSHEPSLEGRDLKLQVPDLSLDDICNQNSDESLMINRKDQNLNVERQMTAVNEAMLNMNLMCRKESDEKAEPILS